MAVYKVPQDVEADDKLIGPFSFRQFIYLLIVAAGLAIGYFLSKLFIPLAIIPLPIVLFFGALALPLRKDQPMETYLAAIVSFYLKPHRRLWNPDGLQTLVQITAPKVVEVQRSNGLSQDEAERRLSYLASVVDSRGWAVRGVDGQQALASSALTSDAFYDAQSAVDMLDDSSGVGKELDSRLDQAKARYHQEMLQRVQKPQPQAQPAAQPNPAITNIPDPYAALKPAPSQPVQQVPQQPTTVPLPQTQAQQTIAPPVQPQQDDQNLHLSVNPYPTSMHQSVVTPVDETRQKPETKTTSETTSEKQLSPDIMNLANNSDLSVETIAREAKRIQDKESSEDEVVISLR